ncbi:GAP family protein [Tenggerimyces flavus]|uniref:GAP family protein n=1 Tax=Tenggerimyces flavus TaxID=1708749 RepID=A0ABV7YPE5_9ACTN|nr:GAP family protein [Tenggerimyces flavus]MBM7785758.1 hypothetical protein [Tenggerimyces flavus]
MTTGLILTLAGLALIDSTSIGTLFIPVWLLLAPGRVRVARIVLYLATIAAFYFAAGLVIAFGVGALADRVGDSIDPRIGLWIQLVLGVGLFVLSFRFDPKRAKKSGRITAWRDRATSEGTSVGWLMGLALLAALAEVATMLPYLGAIGLMTTNGLATGTIAVVLAGYCLVMVVPALVLLTLRLTARTKIEPLLERMNRWVVEKGASATGWILAIAGFLVARDAVARLWFPHLLGQ